MNSEMRQMKAAVLHGAHDLSMMLREPKEMETFLERRRCTMTSSVSRSKHREDEC